MKDCKFNEGVQCESDKCESCGWNPEEQRRRTRGGLVIQHSYCPRCHTIISTDIKGIGKFRKSCKHGLTKGEQVIPDELWEIMMNRMHLYFIPMDDDKTESGLLEEE